MTNKDSQNFMSIANSEGKRALERGDYPAGCVIVRNNEIISKASSMGVSKHDVTAHAELIAISKSCRKLGTRFLQDCIIYTNIEPCLMCAKAIVYAKIKKVIYGVEHREYGTKKSFDILKQNDIAQNIEVVSGLDKDIASELLNKFSKTNTQI